MPGKLDRARFAAARAELKADLELAQLLSGAPAELFENHAALTELALRALANSAEAYVEASAAMGLAQPASPEDSDLLADLGERMSTEDLMRLSTDEVAPAIPELPEEPPEPLEADGQDQDRPDLRRPYEESSDD